MTEREILEKKLIEETEQQFKGELVLEASTVSCVREHLQTAHGLDGKDAAKLEEFIGILARSCPDRYMDAAADEAAE